MKRMNLLPPELKPRDGRRRGSSYVVVGVLAASVAAMLSYAIVIGGVRSDEHELAALKDETADAQARAEALSPYGEFAEMKESREQSVRTVAFTRFNYERLTRELTQVLPHGVWVSHLDVAPSEPAEETVAAGADATTPAEPLGPAMTVSGCASSQDVVADTLDRLRALSGAIEVTLGSSTQSASGSSSSSSGTPYLVSRSGAGATCGQSGRPRVGFDATVVLTAPATDVPAAPTTPTGAGS
jgi:Tfp pilus assembly protein PilN